MIGGLILLVAATAYGLWQFTCRNPNACAIRPLHLAVAFMLLVGVFVCLVALTLYGAWQADILLKRLAELHLSFPLLEYARLSTYLWLGWQLLKLNLLPRPSQSKRLNEIATMGTGEERELAAFLKHIREG